MHPLAKIHRIYTTAKVAAASVGKILSALGMSAVGLFVLLFGLAFADWHGGITFPNVVAVLCVGVALSLAGYSIDKIFEALPGITPRRINDAPGRSRLANRKDLRRGRII